MPRKKQWFKSKVNTFPFEMSKRSRTLAFASLNFRHKKTRKFVKSEIFATLHEWINILWCYTSWKFQATEETRDPIPHLYAWIVQKALDFHSIWKRWQKSAMFTFMSKDKEFWNVVTVLISFLVYFQHQLAKPNATKTNIRWQKNEGVRCSHM